MLWCQNCRLDYGKRYRITVDGMIAIRVLCDHCAPNAQPPKPRWFARLTAKDMTGTAA